MWPFNVLGARFKGSSRLRRALRWAPAAKICSTALLCWFLVSLGGMYGVVGWYLMLFGLPALGVVFLAALLVHAIRKRRYSGAMWATLVVALAALWPLAWLTLLVPITYPADIDETGPAATVRLPLDGPIKVLWGGDHVGVNYHAAFPGQRWAYDLVVEPYVNGSATLTDYGCYGLPVVAPAAGRVVAAHDGEPDVTPGRLSLSFKAPNGNHVAIELPTQTYLVIAHLKMNSVTVSVGQEVDEGEVIGQCGNSGNTVEPHIHIQHQRQDPTVYPVMLDEGLPLFFRDHDGPPMPEGGLKAENDWYTATGVVVQHIGNDAMRP